MKFKRFTAVILSLVLLFATSSIASFSVEAKEELYIQGVENVYIPDDIFYNPPDDLLKGVTFDVILEDGKSENFNFKYQENFLHTSNRNNGYLYNHYLYPFYHGCYFDINVYNYVSEYILIEIGVASTYIYIDPIPRKVIFSQKINYPDDYELGENFIKDNFIYRLNADDTVTIVDYFIRNNDLNNTIKNERIVIPEEVYGKKVVGIENTPFFYQRPSAVEIPENITYISDDVFNNKDTLYQYNIYEKRIEDELQYYLFNCEDSEKVEVVVHAETQVKLLKLIKKYFKDIDYSICSDAKNSILTKLNKKQIYTISNDCYIELKEKPKVSYFILYVLESGKAEKMYVSIEHSTFGDYYSDVTLEDVKKLAEDKDVEKVYMTDYQIDDECPFYKCQYLKYLSMDEDDTINLYLTNSGIFDDSEALFESFINTYFPNCEKYSNGYIVKNISRSYLDYVFFDCEGYLYLGFTFLHDEIFLEKESQIIYCKENSYAEKYAKDHNITYYTKQMPKYINDDVNYDGYVSINDATEVQLFLADLKDLEYDQFELADINDDQIISIDDVTKLQLKLANLVA